MRSPTTDLSSSGSILFAARRIVSGPVDDGYIPQVLTQLLRSLGVNGSKPPRLQRHRLPIVEVVTVRIGDEVGVTVGVKETGQLAIEAGVDVLGGVGHLGSEPVERGTY